MKKVRVFDRYSIPSLPGYTITPLGEVFREPYVKKVVRGGKERSWVVPRQKLKVCMISEYPQISAYKTTFKLHRLLAEVFIDNPENLPQVNHKDGNKFNYSLENLEWCSASYNVKHSYDTGLASNKGEKHPRAKFSNQHIKEIRYLRSIGFSLRELAYIYDVHLSTISKITTGVNYGEEDKGL